jgi:hypothetical protein
MVTGDPTSMTILTIGTNRINFAVPWVDADLDGTDAIDVVAAAADNTATSSADLTLAGITAGTSKRLYAVYGHTDNAAGSTGTGTGRAAFTHPGDMTELFDADTDTGQDASLGAAYLDTVTGATGTRAVTCTPNALTNQRGIGFLFSVNPDPGGGAVDYTATPSIIPATAGTNAPTVSVGSNVSLTPAAQTAVGATRAPTVALSVTVTPAAATAVAGFPALVVELTNIPDAVAAVAGTNAPSVSTGASVTLTPAAVTAAGQTNAPTVTLTADITNTPAAVTATGGTLAPTVSLGQDVALTPGAVSATAQTFTPTVTAGGNVTLTPAAQTAAGQTAAPAVSLGFGISLPAITATAGTVAPTVETAGHVSLTPPAITATAGTGTPAVSVGSVLAVAAISAMAATRTPATAGPVIVYIGRAETGSAGSGRTEIALVGGGNRAE